MKKLFLIILAIFLFPTLCLSAEVISSHKTSRGELIVQSDNRTFDIIKGIYELQGNVHVQLPIRKKISPLKVTEQQYIFINKKFIVKET